MANDCVNHVYFEHSDVGLVRDLYKRFNLKEDSVSPFEFFSAVPNAVRSTEVVEDVNDSGERTKLLVLEDTERAWRTSHWGTYTGAYSFRESNIKFYEEDGFLSAWFHTAWAPPIGVYQIATTKGWLVDAVFWEPAMRVAGSFQNGEANFLPRDHLVFELWCRGMFR